MSHAQQCRAVVISACASGQGKTSVTAALARYYRQQGHQVRVFKTGPDFLDPMILEQASGHPVYQLDLWMVGETHSRQLLDEAARSADIILVEGVMGLFDGQPSTADLAAKLQLPVLAVINVSAMAQTVGAIVHGLAHYRDDLNFAGVIFNQVGSDYHQQLVAEALPQHIPWFGSLPRQHEQMLPSRHLGLVQAAEIDDLNQRLSELAAKLVINTDAQLPLYQSKTTEIVERQPLLAGQTIAVARDEAFSFIYQANLDLLVQLGAKLRFFSPLEDSCLPEADSLYLPGGYPELHLQTLAANKPMLNTIRAHYQQAKPIVAECGGMLYLCDSLTDKQGNQAELVGVLKARAVMQKSLSALGLQQVDFNEGSLRGHSYHHSTLNTEMEPLLTGQCPNKGKTAEAVYHQQGLTASYIHFYFPSNPEVSAALFLS